MGNVQLLPRQLLGMERFVASKILGDEKERERERACVSNERMIC